MVDPAIFREIIIYTLVYIVPLIVTVFKAHEKNRNIFLWGLLTFILPLFTPIVISFVTNRKQTIIPEEKQELFKDNFWGTYVLIMLVLGAFMAIVGNLNRSLWESRHKADSIKAVSIYREAGGNTEKIIGYRPFSPQNNPGCTALTEAMQPGKLFSTS